jgi:hypothetical protein
MNAYLRSIAFLFTLVSLASTGAALAQSDTALGNNASSQAELDQMLAPVALYPDELLTQVLTAATYPLEIVEAARWSQANPDLTGTDAVNAVDAQDWDQSVKTLLAFPDLLQMMDDKLDWTERLGDTFLAQQAQVMDTVQSLRRKAEAAGTLSSGGELRVDDEDGNIGIEPAAPDLVYLPYYDPNVVYGSWWWPGYPPVYWTPWPGYGWQGGFAWGTGIAIGGGFFLDDFDWHRHCINVYDHGRPRHERGRLASNEPPHVWQHDPMHRRGVTYRNTDLNRRFGRASVAAGTSVAFRGHDEFGHAVGARIQRGYMGPGMQRSYAPPNMRRGFVAPHIEMQPRAFSGGGRMAAVRGSAGAEHASMQHAPARGAPSSDHHP